MVALRDLLALLFSADTTVSDFSTGDALHQDRGYHGRLNDPLFRKIDALKKTVDSGSR